MTPSWLSPSQTNQFLASGTTAFRICASPDGWVDWWNGHVLISADSEESGRILFQELQSWQADASQFSTSVLFRKLVKAPGEKDVPTLWEGSLPPSEFSVQENGLSFLINLGSGYSTGLFCDQRENRQTLRSWIQSSPTTPSLLNCFSYTSAFSVAAASAGALTCSVDISPRFLQWGKRNFSANHIDDSAHRFFNEDVLSFLPRLIKREEKFSFIILDPPTFSRNRKGKVFRIERDFSHLLELALACSLPHTKILLSTNCSRISTESLWNLVREVSPDAKIIPGITPFDFSPYPPSTTLWLQCES